jgi:hypothetical protein
MLSFIVKDEFKKYINNFDDLSKDLEILNLWHYNTVKCRDILKFY